MNGDSHETGWLELKAIDKVLTHPYWEIRASQHTWMEAHAKKVPCHFLLAMGDHIFLFKGEMHSYLAVPRPVSEIRRLSIDSCDKSAIRLMLVDQLSQLTSRYR